MSIIKIFLNLIAMLVGVAFIGLAYFYWVTPAGTLPPILSDNHLIIPEQSQP